ncbi:MAG: aminotransferase class V-fold PLP-dependent enzyme [Gemmatimonadota bacterium]|nr:aminotransferase class V-fold PLP-dependent enzyme [Gemmatimonadota bacterium]MDH3424649.1 aminotransferase class V-fold PLP-dependent enzyme [Gemmatimonadota bacterium]
MTLGRRRFLSLVGGASLAWPKAVDAIQRELASGGAQDDEAFWSLVRRQFSIPPDRIYLNNGTLGPSPRVVVDAVTEHTRLVASTYPPGVSWDDLKASVAALVGGEPEGFVFPRNTTEAVSFVANGLDIGPGDDVVSTDHEHIGGLEPWKSVTARRGASLTIASLPVPAADAGSLADTVWSTVSPSTRVLAVSHMTFTTGTVLPIAELARRCASAGVILCVDGAHPPGMLSVDLARLGGDFYASSPHKWMLAPQGTGLLYLSERWREALWPTLASGGWDDRSLGAHRLNHMGTIDESRPAGLLAASEFLQAIGAERIEARTRYLRGLLENGLRSIPGVDVTSPEAEGLKGAMVSFSLNGVESAELQRHLSRVASIRTRVIGEYAYGWMRLSTHIYNTPAEIEYALDLVDEVSRNGLSG